MAENNVTFRVYRELCTANRIEFEEEDTQSVLYPRLLFKFTEKDPKFGMWVCEKCDHPIFEKDEICMWCGHDFRDDIDEFDEFKEKITEPGREVEELPRKQDPVVKVAIDEDGKAITRSRSLKKVGEDNNSNYGSFDKEENKEKYIAYDRTEKLINMIEGMMSSYLTGKNNVTSYGKFYVKFSSDKIKLFSMSTAGQLRIKYLGVDFKDVAKFVKTFDKDKAQHNGLGSLRCVVKKKVSLEDVKTILELWFAKFTSVTM